MSIIVMVVAQIESLDFTYSKLPEGSVLYFDARGEVQLSTTDWRLVTYVNIQQPKHNLVSKAACTDCYKI